MREANLAPGDRQLAPSSTSGARSAPATGWRGGAALHVDTGMNRLGFPSSAAAALASRVGNDPGIALVMSHFACSEEEHPLNAVQIERFRAVRALFPGIAGSLANSSGIFLGAGRASRPGAPRRRALRRQPDAGQAEPDAPGGRARRAASCRSATVEPGATVGYSATWTAKRPTRLAIVSVGYADGFPRAASASDARPRRGGDRRRAALPPRRPRLDGPDGDRRDRPADAQVARGDLVTLLGDGIGVDDLAARAGTIGYEVLTSLGRRYRRVYRS